MHTFYHRSSLTCAELSDCKISDGIRKWPLRQLLYRSVPSELIERPKKGFSIPLNQWLSGPLKEWAEELLSPVKLKQQGFFQADWIREEWRRVQKTPQDSGSSIWVILMFQAWLEAYSVGGIK